jgi:hypothetical protein
VRAPRAAPRPSDATLLRTIRLAAETAIGENGAATTEEIYYVLIPRLLESCLATEASANGFDLVTTLGKQGFRFNEASGKWELPPGYLFDPDLPAPVRARAYLRQCLADAKVNGRPAELGAVLSYLAGRVAPSERIPEDVVLRELRCVGRPVRDDLWELREPTGQTVMF